LRLFIAIRLSETMRSALEDAQAQLRRVARGGNFTRRENLHLTLVFIGESEDTEALRRIMEQSVGAPFSMALGGSGHFDDLYWAGIAPAPPLNALAKRLIRALREAGFDIEEREFTPHITLVRQLRCDEKPHLRVPSAEMTVTEISLMRSEHVKGKLVYTELFSCPME